LSERVTPNTAKKRIAGALPDPNQLVKYTNDEALFKAWTITGLSGWIKRQMLSQSPQKSSDDDPVTLHSHLQVR